MKTFKIFSAVLALTMILAILFVFAVSAEGLSLNNDDSIFEDIVICVGSDETQKNISWYSTENVSGEIDYAVRNSDSNEFPDEYKTVKATVAKAKIKTGFYVNYATIIDLTSETEYVYRLRAGGKMSAVYSFDTGSFGDYDFIFAGDPQIKTESHGRKWSDTLNKIFSHFSNAKLIVSAGDQVGSNGSVDIGESAAEVHWSNFLVDELRQITFAPSAGPAHDIKSSDDSFSSYSEHFYFPNLSDKYGVTESASDYWYTYNNTLFMHLNVADHEAIHSEHEQFITEAMLENPYAVWKIVVIHYPQYSVGPHANPENQYYNFVTKTKREALAPQFTALGVDLVLSGHDHLYVRSEIMNVLLLSDDVIENNCVTDPKGPLYVVAGSSTGTSFAKNELSSESSYYAAKISDESRKSII